MKKLSVFFLIFTIILKFTVGIATATAVDIPQTPVSSCNGIDANSAMLGTKKITDNVRAAFLYEANSQTLMYAVNPDKAMHPASLVKIMSALVAIDAGELDDFATASDVALSSVPYDAVSVNLQVGEQMKLIDLLYCMIVGSANDAATVIAEHISGSQDAFVSKMNQVAQEIGCTGTNFTNVHGMHNEEQVTTARDIARILDKALANKTFRTIFTTKQHRVEATNMSDSRTVTSSNAILDSLNKQYFDKRVIGGRTGVTDDGRRCLAAAAESNGMLLISVVMGTESVYQEDGFSAISVGGYYETTALLDAGFKGYKTAQIMYANQAMEQCKVDEGNCDLIIGPIDAVFSVLPTDTTLENLSYHYTVNGLKAPISKGQKITDLQIWNGSMCVAQTELYALNSVNIITVDDSLSNPQEEGSGTTETILFIIGLLIIVVILLTILRLHRLISALFARKRSNQYRRSHRRSR